MEQITLRLPKDVLEEVEGEADDHGQTRSEYLRDVITSRNDEQEEANRLREKVNELQTTVERLQNEKRTILEQREEHTDLVRAVEQERSLQEQKARAGLMTRAKWWAFGMDDEDSL